MIIPRERHKRLGHKVADMKTSIEWIQRAIKTQVSRDAMWFENRYSTQEVGASLEQLIEVAENLKEEIENIEEIRDIFFGDEDEETKRKPGPPDGMPLHVWQHQENISAFIRMNPKERRETAVFEMSEDDGVEVPLKELPFHHVVAMAGSGDKEAQRFLEDNYIERRVEWTNSQKKENQ